MAKIEDTYLRLQKAEFEGIIARDRSQKEFLEREVRRLRTLAQENIAAKNLLDQTEFREAVKALPGYNTDVMNETIAVLE